MKSLTIDRQRWGRNHLVRKSDKKMCCLGFACVRTGDLKLGEVKHPNSVPTKQSHPKFFADPQLRRLDMDEAVSINDSRKSNRESLLTSLFKRAGIRLRFVN